MKERKPNAVTIGVIGICEAEDLPRIRKNIENLPDFKLVYSRTSVGRLWIKAGDSL